MKNKRLFYNKTAKGLISLITIIILLSSILAVSIFYNNNITANVIKKSTIFNGGFFSNVQIQKVDDIKQLSELNEGWYEIRNGYVFYLEGFNTAIPIYIKVRNPKQQNMLVVVDENGNVIVKKINAESIDFFSNINEKEKVSTPRVETFSDINQITGKVTGLEKVRGSYNKITGAADERKKQVTQLTIKPIPKKYEPFLEKAAKKYGGNDKETFYYDLAAIANVESYWNPTARSPVGALGIMQIMPSTARGFGVGMSGLFDAETNIDTAAKYYRFLLDRYGSRTQAIEEYYRLRAIAAYNSGPGRVNVEIPNIQETQRYVVKVDAASQIYEETEKIPDGMVITLEYSSPVRIKDFGTDNIRVVNVKVPRTAPPSIIEGVKDFFNEVVGRPVPGTAEPSPAVLYQDGDKVRATDNGIFTRVKGVWVSTYSEDVFNDEQIRGHLKSGRLFRESISQSIKEESVYKTEIRLWNKDEYQVSYNKYTFDYVDDRPDTGFGLLSDIIGSKDQKDINKYYQMNIDGRGVIVATDQKGQTQLFLNGDVISKKSTDGIIVYTAKSDANPVQLKSQGTLQIFEKPQPPDVPPPKAKREIVVTTPAPPPAIYNFGYGDQVIIDGILYTRILDSERREPVWIPEREEDTRFEKKDSEIFKSIGGDGSRIIRKSIEDKIRQLSIEEIEFIIKAVEGDPFVDARPYEKILQEKKEQAEREGKKQVDGPKIEETVKGDGFYIVEIDGKPKYLTDLYSYDATDNKDGTYSVTIYNTKYKMNREGVIIEEVVEKPAAPALAPAPQPLPKQSPSQTALNIINQIKSDTTTQGEPNLIERSREKAKNEIKDNQNELTKMIISGQLSQEEFDRIAKENRLDENIRLVIVGGVAASKGYTGRYKDAINKQIEGYGNPDDWRIDNQGNFICVKDICSLATEGDAWFYNQGTIFAPGGGKVNNLGDNIVALKELMPKEAVAPRPTPPPAVSLVPAAGKVPIASVQTAQINQPTEAQLKTIADLELERGTKTVYADGTIKYEMGNHVRYVYTDGGYGAVDEKLGTVTIYDKSGNLIALDARPTTVPISQQQPLSPALAVATAAPPQIGTSPDKYANPQTSRESKYVRSDNYELVDKKVCDKEVNCAEVKPGQQWVPGVGVVDMASPVTLIGTPIVVSLSAAVQRVDTPRRTGAVVLNNQLIEIYEKDKETNLQKVVIGRTYKPDGSIEKEGKEITVHSTILSGLDLKSLANVDLTQDIFSFGTPQKKVVVSITSDTQTRTDAEIAKDGKITKTTKTEFFTGGDKKGETKTTTTNNLRTKQEQKTELTTFVNGVTKEIKSEPGKELLADKSTITYSSPTGEKITMEVQAYKDMDKNFESRLVQAAFDVGITKIDRYENGFKQGTNGVQFGSDKTTIYSIKGYTLVSSSAQDGTYNTYQNTNFDSTNLVPMFKAGSVVTTKKGEDLKTVKEYTKEDEFFEYRYVGSNKEGYNSMDVYKMESYIGSVTLDPINKPKEDPESKFNGMYELQFYPSGYTSVEYQKLYFQTGYGPGGFLGTYYVDANGNKLDDKKIKELGLPDPKMIERSIGQSSLARNQPSPAQLSSQSFFANVERILTEFQGLGYYATFFFDQNSLLQWRENVDRAFATLYLGTEYWASGICGQYLNGEDEGIAFAETPQGLAQVGAHIEATRSEPIITPTGNEFIYKITFNVRNGDFEKDTRAPEEMRINVVLKGSRTATVFKQDQLIKRGNTFGRIGTSAIVKSSTALYNQVCLKFDKIPFKWKIKDKELCNTIQQSSGTPNSLSTPAPASAPASSGGSSGDMNDF